MFCKDTWNKHIPPEKLAAYQALISEGVIRNHHVTYERRTGRTTVEYCADMPHESVREELKKRSQSS